MPKTLAELRKSPHVGRPETEFTICIAGKLNAEFDQIDHELDQILNEQPTTPADPDAPKPPGRMGRRGTNPETQKRITELNERREELRTVMADHKIPLRLRAREDGTWRTWVNEHPPRPDNTIDEGAGHDVDALITDIRTHGDRYVVTINGDPYTAEAWAFVWTNAAPGDQWRLTAVVRGLHQSVVDVPKSLTPYLPTSGASSS